MGPSLPLKSPLRRSLSKGLCDRRGIMIFVSRRSRGASSINGRFIVADSLYIVDLARGCFVLSESAILCRRRRRAWRRRGGVWTKYTAMTALSVIAQRINNVRTHLIKHAPILALILSPRIEKIPVPLSEPETKCRSTGERFSIS